MGVKGVGFQLDDGYGDVGAVVGDPFEVCHQVVKDEALGQSADAVLQPVDVVQLHLVAESVNQLLQRLNPGGRLQVVVDEGLICDVDDLGDRRPHGCQLPGGGF